MNKFELESKNKIFKKPWNLILDTNLVYFF